MTTGYYFEALLQEADLYPMENKPHFEVQYAGEHNRLWYAIARDGSQLPAQYAAQVGSVALALRDTGLQTGIELANALTMTSQATAHRPDQFLGPPQGGQMATCPDAEIFFSRVATPGATDRPPHDSPYSDSMANSETGGFLVLHDSVGRAVLLEKNNYGRSSTALALQEIVIDSIPYPPGFIFAVSHQQFSSVKAARLPNRRAVLTAPVTDVMHIQPRRLSIFNIPLQERPLVAADLLKLQAESKHAFTPNTANWTMQDLQSLLGINFLSDARAHKLSRRALTVWDWGFISQIFAKYLIG